MLCCKDLQCGAHVRTMKGCLLTLIVYHVSQDKDYSMLGQGDHFIVQKSGQG